MNNIGIVLPMGQNRKRLEESGQWSLWQQELEFYQKKFSRVELFEYRHKDWRRYVEALLLPVIQANRFQRCQVLKAVHLTGVIPCLVARLLYKTPYVLSYGYRYDEFASVEGKWNVWLLSKLLTPMAIKFSSAAMVPTENLKNYAGKFGAKKIEIIPNGVDTRMFSVKTNKLTNEQTNKKTDKTLSKVELQVLFVGRLEKQKNLKTLILAMASFHEFQKNFGDRGQQNGIPIRLMFVGKGSLEQELQILADRLSVNLTIHQPISNEKLPEVYQQADIFVLPSLAEGHPKVLLEAMSCGAPCLASAIPGVNEIIVDGKNGLLVEPTAEGIAGGLRKLIYSPELRKRLGSAARKTVIEKFDKKRLMEKEISFLQSHFELVEKSRPPMAADLYR